MLLASVSGSRVRVQICLGLAGSGSRLRGAAQAKAAPWQVNDSPESEAFSGKQTPWQDPAAVRLLLRLLVDHEVGCMEGCHNVVEPAGRGQASRHKPW